MHETAFLHVFHTMEQWHQHISDLERWRLLLHLPCPCIQYDYYLFVNLRMISSLRRLKHVVKDRYVRRGVDRLGYSWRRLYWWNWLCVQNIRGFFSFFLIIALQRQLKKGFLKTLTRLSLANWYPCSSCTKLSSREEVSFIFYRFKAIIVKRFTQPSGKKMVIGSH